MFSDKFTDETFNSSVSQLLDQGNYREAVSRSAERLGHFPDDRRALGFLVEGLLGFGHMPNAIDVLRKVRAGAPDNDLATFGLAIALDKGNRDECYRLVGDLLANSKTDLFRGEEGPVKLSPVIEAADWCGAHNATVLEPAQDVTVFDPVRSAQTGFRSDAVVSAVVPGATVVADWDFVITAAGEVLNGSGFHDIAVAYKALRHFFDSAKRTAIHAWPIECVEVEEDALFISGVSGTTGFGHWVCDFLPRLRGWMRPGQRPLKIAASRSLNQHQCDTLAQFGVRGSDIIWCEPRKRYRFRELTFVMPGDMYRPNPAIVRFLHNGLGPDPATRPKRNEMGRWFFLERSGTKRGRYISNADETRTVLEEIGFEFVRRPEVPVPQQNEMFRDAGVVVGIYGTDLITLYQLRPGTDLVVLYFDQIREGGADLGTAAFAAMCEIAGVRLHVLLCKSTAKSMKSEYYEDIVVNCDALRDRLYEIIERRSLDYAASWEATK